MGSVGVILGLTRSGSVTGLPVSLNTVLVGLGIFGLLFSIALPRLYERNQWWQGRYILATRRAEDATQGNALHLYDDNVIANINARGGSWTGRVLLLLGYATGLGWLMFAAKILRF